MEPITVIDNGKAIVRIHPGNKTPAEQRAMFENAAIKYAAAISKHSPAAYERLRKGC